jgi:hypothetical protein
MTLPELRAQLALAIDVYNRTPARDGIASAQAKRRVTRLRNQIAKMEARPSFVSSTPRAPRNKRV